MYIYYKSCLTNDSIDKSESIGLAPEFHSVEIGDVLLSTENKLYICLSLKIDGTLKRLVDVYSISDCKYYTNLSFTDFIFFNTLVNTKTDLCNMLDVNALMNVIDRNFNSSESDALVKTYSSNKEEKPHRSLALLLEYLNEKYSKYF